MSNVAQNFKFLRRVALVYSPKYSHDGHEDYLKIRVNMMSETFKVLVQNYS